MDLLDVAPRNFNLQRYLIATAASAPITYGISTAIDTLSGSIGDFTEDMLGFRIGYKPRKLPEDLSEEEVRKIRFFEDWIEKLGTPQPLFRPIYNSIKQWITGKAQPIPIYGRFVGPRYSAGREFEEDEKLSKADINIEPIDALDKAAKLHDIQYSIASSIKDKNLRDAAYRKSDDIFIKREKSKSIDTLSFVISTLKFISTVYGLVNEARKLNKLYEDVERMRKENLQSQTEADRLDTERRQLKDTAIRTRKELEDLEYKKQLLRYSIENERSQMVQAFGENVFEEKEREIGRLIAQLKEVDREIRRAKVNFTTAQRRVETQTKELNPEIRRNNREITQKLNEIRRVQGDISNLEQGIPTEDTVFDFDTEKQILEVRKDNLDKEIDKLQRKNEALLGRMERTERTKMLNEIAISTSERAEKELRNQMRTTREIYDTLDAMTDELKRKEFERLVKASDFERAIIEFRQNEQRWIQSEAGQRYRDLTNKINETVKEIESVSQLKKEIATQIAGSGDIRTASGIAERIISPSILSQDIIRPVTNIIIGDGLSLLASSIFSQRISTGDTKYYTFLEHSPEEIQMYLDKLKEEGDNEFVEFFNKELIPIPPTPSAPVQGSVVSSDEILGPVPIKIPETVSPYQTSPFPIGSVETIVVETPVPPPTLPEEPSSGAPPTLPEEPSSGAPFTDRKIGGIDREVLLAALEILL